MNNQGKDELTYNSDLFVFIGFFIPNGKPIKKLHILWYTLTFLQFLILHILYFVQLFTDELSLATGINIVTSVISLIQFIFTRLYFTFKLKDISALVQDICVSPINNSKNFAKMEKKMKLEVLEYLKRITRIGITFTSIATTLFILRVLFQSAIKSLRCANQVECDSGYVLIYDIWWPYDAHHGLSFYLLMTWQMGNLALTTFSTAITDVFSCGVAFVAAERSKLLSKIAPTALLPTKNNEMSKECRNWLRYHQHYLRIVREINTTIGPVYFLAYVLGAINIIALSYVSVKASDPVLLGQTIAILVIVFFRLYAIAYAGQKVYTHSAELSRCTLNAVQVSKGGLKDGPVRSILLVLATRLSGGIKPEQISGSGYFSISMDFFTKVLSISCSYLFILLQLQSQSNKKLNE